MTTTSHAHIFLIPGFPSILWADVFFRTTGLWEQNFWYHTYFSCCRKFDRDGNGYISPDELLYVVCNSGEKLSREEAEELIGMFDKNDDGQLSWEEFVEFFKCDREATEGNVTIPEESSQEEPQLI